MDTEILKPVVALAAWTLVMLVWLMVARLPAMQKAGIRMGSLVGTKAADADAALPPKAQWPAHNYMHLVEQPTLFYAVAIVLALIGQGHGLNLQIAWAYVVLRVLHSLVQATINRVLYRFVLFGLSTVALVMLTVHAAMSLWGVTLH